MRGNKVSKVHPGESEDPVDKFESDWESLLKGDVFENAISTEPLKRTLTNASDEFDTSQHSVNSNSDDEDSENGDDTVQNMTEKLNTLILQLDDLRGNYSTERNARKKMEVTNKELMLQIADLEEENSEMHEALKQKVESSRRTSVAVSSSRRPNKRVSASRNSANNREQDIRLALIDGDDEDVAVDFNDFVQSMSAFSNITRSLYSLMPFKKDAREVQASFGGAVAAYFNFFRWMLFNFIVVGIIGVLFSSIHIITIIFRGHSSGLLTGNGFLPGYMQYSSFNESERFMYTCNVIVGNAALIILCVRKIVVEDKMMKRLDLIENENDFTFSKDIFGGWDHSLTSDTEVTDLHGLLSQSYREKLAELKSAGRKMSRSNLQIFELYLRRSAGCIIYLTIQFASYTAIVYLTVKSQSIQKGLSSVSFLKSLSSLLVPGAVTAINSATPSIYKLLTDIELWDSGQVQLNVLLFRMYLSNMMNLFILAVSYALLADPFLFAEDTNKELRKQVEHEFTADYDCRMNQASDGMFSLILTEFFLNGIVYFAVGYGPVFVSRNIMPFPKQEFKIAQRMVALLYFVSLMMLTFPFAPLSVVLFPFMLAARIKWEKHVTMKFYSKPQTVWAAHKAGSFFVMFYMVSLTCVAVPAALYFLSRKSFPKDCDIQDIHIGLCDSDVNATTQVCSLDSSSQFYSLYKDSSYCREGYPACVCSYSCGAFVGDVNAFRTFRNSLRSIKAIEIIWEYIFQNSYGAWILVLFFYVVSKTRKNTISVNNQGFKEKERGLETHITVLENEKKKHEKIISRLKLMEGSISTTD